MLGIQTKIHYDEKFDPQCRSVFCQNHVNLLDGFIATASIPHVFCGLMHAWQFWIPIYGWLMKISQGIAVHQKKKSGKLQDIIEQAKKRKQMGYSILCFPEGHRTRDGHVHSFRKGMFFMARESGYPIVPIAVKGNYEINQKGSRLFHPGNLEVFVGPQCSTEGLSDMQIETLAQRTQQWIRQKVEGQL